MAPRRLILACLAIVVLGFVAQVLAECRHGCSNHGDCHHGSCRCNTGWAGDDCSEADTPLNSGEVVRGSLNSFTWHYYHVQVPYGTSALNITAHQTSRYGDVDVYVQRDRFPTERDYAARDVGTDPDIYLQLPNPAPGRWYIGMYGYWHVDYTLQVDIIAGCPLDCGENGQCSGRECVCNSPYAGETCNIYDRPLNSGVPFTESVATGEWKFFRISTAPNNYLDIVVVEDGAGDVDVYVKRDTYPSFFDFDYLNGTIHPTSTVHLDDAEVGVWRIGIYGYRGDRFTITATVGASLGCSGQCSGASHGACNGRRCQCLAEYTGELCERKRVSLALDTPVTGFVDTNFWNYYTFRIVTQNNVIIRTVQTSSSGSDCDVFVKAGSDPTRIDYEYANLSNLADFNVTIPEPGDTEWHIGVYGWTSCAYTLSITIPVTCSCVGDNGYCEPGSDVCVCNAGWSGITCQDHASILNMGQVYTQQSVEQYQWKYYSISSNSSAMLVSLRETSTRGYLWLFMSQGSFPTLENYEEADKETNTNFHEVHAVFQRAEVRVFYIGVYGNPFGVRGNDGTPFSITAWAPPF